VTVVVAVAVVAGNAASAPRALLGGCGRAISCHGEVELVLLLPLYPIGRVKKERARERKKAQQERKGRVKGCDGEKRTSCSCVLFLYC
jgi:hypothetical protein